MRPSSFSRLINFRTSCADSGSRAAVGSPDYFSYMAGAVKDFFDRTFYPSQGKVAGKPCVLFVSGGGEDETAKTIIHHLAISIYVYHLLGGWIEKVIENMRVAQLTTKVNSIAQYFCQNCQKAPPLAGGEDVTTPFLFLVKSRYNIFLFILKIPLIEKH